jgi:ribosomal protein S18 acetylase RimI-like enzyme
VTIQELERSSVHGTVHHGWIPADRSSAASAERPDSLSTAPLIPKQLAVTTRPMNDDDSMLLFELYASSRADELSRSGWATPQQRSFFRMQAQNQERYFQRHYDHLDRRTICINGFSAGRLLVDRPAHGITIVDLALLPAFRGRGVGSLLIRCVLEEAAERDLPVHMDLAKNNATVATCERLGFRFAEDLGDRWHLVWNPRAQPLVARHVG